MKLMIPPMPTELLHLLLAQAIESGAYVIDATAGNGYDTVFLAQTVGENGQVLAIDLQAQAIESTKNRLKSASLQAEVNFYQGCHSRLADLDHPRAPQAILFNLGYLPGGDHQIITQPSSTLEALSAAVSLLPLGGVVAVVCYPGHEGGDSEAEQVEKFIEQLSDFRIARYDLVATLKVSPILFFCAKVRMS